MEIKYCIFLRGINVNGIKITMQAIKEAFKSMGFTEIQTILATGNVIATAPDGFQEREALKAFIEKGLSEHFGYDAHVLLRNKKEMLEICSVAQNHIVPEGYHHYLLLCDHFELPLELEKQYNVMSHVSNEQLVLSRQDAFWIIPKGNTLDSNFGSKVLGSKKYKSRLTSRNMNTIHKIMKCM